MKKIFLTSSLGTNIKIDGIKIPKSLDNSNNIIEQLKESLPHYKKFIYMASAPSNYENNDTYSSVVYESLKLSGITFGKYVLVDYRYEGNLEEEIKDASLILLSGGDPKEEMDYFEEINFRNIIRGYDGVLLGQSAGSMNMAKVVVCPPEDISQIGGNYVFNGLDIIDINIEPHFAIDIDTSLEEIILIRKELLKISEDHTLYGLTDGSHIVFLNDEYILYGDAYLIKDRKTTKINKIVKGK